MCCTSHVKPIQIFISSILLRFTDVAAEKTQQALLQGVEGFDTTNLKHTDTVEKVVLPDKDVIESEKTQQAILKGVEGFDPKNLKHAETKESNSLPTKEGK